MIYYILKIYQLIHTLVVWQLQFIIGVSNNIFLGPVSSLLKELEPSQAVDRRFIIKDINIPT